MKKIVVAALMLTCVLGLVGCIQEESELPKYSDGTTPVSEAENNPTITENKDNNSTDTQWLDGIAFVELAPGEEIKSPSEIIVDVDNSTFQFVMTYARAGLTLEYGLQAEDGTEYSKEIVGGNDVYAIEDIPAGTYLLFVRNSGDYSDLPAYQDKSISFNATGAINYHLGNTQS